MGEYLAWNEREHFCDLQCVLGISEGKSEASYYDSFLSYLIHTKVKGPDSHDRGFPVSRHNKILFSGDDIEEVFVCFFIDQTNPAQLTRDPTLISTTV